MRLRIKKNSDGSVFTVVVTGAMDDSQAWDMLLVAQTMLGMARCRELVLDLRDAFVDEEVTVFNTDTLMSVFEEALCLKDRTVVIYQPSEGEIRISSDQLPLAGGTWEQIRISGRAALGPSKACGNSWPNRPQLSR